MSKAYLTIDDGPTALTPAFTDFLCERGITPVMNFIGASMDEFCNQAVYAIRRGAIIGNHGYWHNAFSELTPEQCRSEIALTEEKIDSAYQRAGVARAHRVFRFPYGDKGGDNAVFLQQILRDEFHFERLDSAGVTFPWWKENNLDTDIDMHWTFDFVEYQLAWDNGYTWDSVVKHILDKNPPQGGALLCEHATHIVLMHDHEKTNAFLPGYYEKLIDYVMKLGVEFINPVFI